MMSSTPPAATPATQPNPIQSDPTLRHVMSSIGMASSNMTAKPQIGGWNHYCTQTSPALSGPNQSLTTPPPPQHADFVLDLLAKRTVTAY